MKYLFLLLMLFLGVEQLIANPEDSLHISMKTNGLQRSLDRMTASKLYQMTYAGVPLVVSGLIVKGEDDHFRQLRNNYMPTFSKRYDDYTQYLPAAVMLGLKIGGVQGRSSWSRMLVSDAFSAMIMASFVLPLKYATNVERPDGSNHHSFPSGHTATAFMTATMLSKEYGDRSPWYSIAAYSLAASTGLTRMANNKHWLSDVLAGAGFGILSTEIGYFLADLIFKERGITHFKGEDFGYQYDQPSFVGVRIGIEMIPGKFELMGGDRLSFLSGASGGIEGAWFSNSWLGVGGELSASNMTVVVDNLIQNKSLSMLSAKGGLYFSYPLATQVLIGAKTLVGYHHYFSTHLNENAIALGDRGGACIGIGTALTIFPKERFGVRFFFDYDMLPKFVRSDKSVVHRMTLGGMATVVF